MGFLNATRDLMTLGMLPSQSDAVTVCPPAALLHLPPGSTEQYSPPCPGHIQPVRIAA